MASSPDSGSKKRPPPSLPSKTGGAATRALRAITGLSRAGGAATRILRAITGPWTRANGISWLQLIVFILVLRWAFFELYSIPSGSMEPTLHGDPRFLRGDRVAVNKFVFGPRIPFTTLRLLRLGEPKRWDIVVFNNVEADAEHKRLIKRVVGLPGERIHIGPRAIFVNGKRVRPPEELREVLRYTTRIIPEHQIVRRRFLEIAKNNQLPEPLNPGNPGVAVLRTDINKVHSRVRDLDLENLDEGQEEDLVSGVDPDSFRIVSELLSLLSHLEKPFRYGILEDDEFSVVPEGHYFMLGDNSANSLDGRYFGWVPHRNLYGRAFAVALPFSRSKDLTGFSSTWWGAGLLYGLPGLIVLYEIIRGFVVFSWPVRKAVAARPLAEGDRVFINRITFGLRIPFTSRRVGWNREPRPGELVAYFSKGDDDSPLDLYYGHIVGEDEFLEHKGTALDEHEAQCFVHNAGAFEEHWLAIGRERLVGTVSAVWWPLRRRRRFRLEDSEGDGSA